MQPIEFPQSNRTLTAPEGRPDVKNLHVWTNEEYCVSCWQPAWKDRLRLLFGRPLWVWLMTGGTQPPISVSTDRAFDGREGGGE